MTFLMKSLNSMNKYLFLFLILLGWSATAQEFKCNVTIDASGIQGSNKQIFKSLERSIEEFVNNNRWTDKRFLPYEKIKCDIILNVKSYDRKSNEITSELYFRSYRPIYKSDYQTLLLNLIDKNFKFQYQQFQKLDFNPEFFTDNLTSTLAFYLYVALGHDFESFKQDAGRPFFEKAEIVQKNAAQNGLTEWEAKNGGTGKGDLIELLLDEQSKYYHKTIYTYHRWGLDKMADNLKLGKSNIITAINYLSKLKMENRNASYLIKIFFDAKSDEIVQIFKEGPRVNLNYIVNKLESLAPNYHFKWQELKGGNARLPRTNEGEKTNPRKNFGPPRMRGMQEEKSQEKEK